ncbi:hypothetical protein P170DRAFT_472163 [Aspergillus steynii IBT 23096]|uniref:Uncharacterized protein n=1 Tax=Aspergillus steynii IBT 23096 TaxID=1392250 RepID=A0A2I2GHB0_9EURO|nr:uncharacterized protein P170DRAFT_472163 [Aspergillus steynii IBT 23096]PLB52256.1 hypothetical protein P170DRAFT_472163 [Aspergillus steynii IBT 23096]
MRAPDSWYERRHRLETQYGMEFVPFYSHTDPYFVVLRFDVVLPMNVPNIREVTCQLTYQIKQRLETKSFKQLAVRLPPTKARIKVIYDLRRLGDEQDPSKTTAAMIYRAVQKELGQYDHDYREFSNIANMYRVADEDVPYFRVQLEYWDRIYARRRALNINIDVTATNVRDECDGDVGEFL